jgi:hypothetical protein
MGQNLGAGKIIDGNDINAFHVEYLAINKASYPSESIDCYFYCAHVGCF